MPFLRELWSARELLGNLILREVRGQYKRTLLGRLWSLLNPLALMLIYTFVFSFVLRMRPEAGDPSGLDVFPLWLLCGLLPWTFFATSVNLATGSLIANAALITKVYFARSVLPLAAVGTTGINWAIELTVLSIALLLFGANVLPWLAGVVLFMLLLAVFVAGLGWIFSVISTYFRDVQYLLSLVLQFWMYLTPIIYPAYLIEQLSDRIGGLLNTPVTVLDVYALNPMYHFVAVFRQLLYDNRWPDTTHVLSCVCWTLAAVLIGAFVFNKKSKRIAEIL